MNRSLTVNDVAQRLTVTADHVRALITGGRIRAMNVSAGTRPLYRIDPEDLEAYIDSRKAEAAAPAAARGNRTKRPSRRGRLRLAVTEFF